MVHILLPYTPFEPVGGVRTAFDYVMRLNELAGHQIADIIADSKFIKSWLPTDYRSVHVLPTSTKLLAEDTLILPEVILEEASRYPQVKRKLLMVLNWKYFEEGLKANRLKKLGYSGILTNSAFSKERLARFSDGLPVYNIPHLIDTSVFNTTLHIAKRPRHSVLVLSRKNTQHIPGIIEFLKGFSHTLTVLNNIEPDKMPSQYANHQIFINLGYPEGFCRPAAEAMASGCVVVGFTGGGGSDFMINSTTALTAEDGNETQLLEQLNRALHMSDKQKQGLAKAARALIASRYTKELQAKALNTIFEKEIGKVMSAAQIARLYPSARKARSAFVAVKGTRLPQSKTVEVMEYQLFQERKQHQALRESKVFKIWQAYCNLRAKVGRTLNLSQA